jgi:hypothetical protein
LEANGEEFHSKEKLEEDGDIPTVEELIEVELSEEMLRRISVRR